MDHSKKRVTSWHESFGYPGKGGVSGPTLQPLPRQLSQWKCCVWVRVAHWRAQSGSSPLLPTCSNTEGAKTIKIKRSPEAKESPTRGLQKATRCKTKEEEGGQEQELAVQVRDKVSPKLKSFKL